MRFSGWATLVVMAVALGAGGTAVRLSGAPEIAIEQWPADGVTTVRIDAVDAFISVQAADDDTIRATWADGGILSSSRKGSTLSLRAQDGGRAGTLTVEMPARLALDVRYRDGRVHVSGVRGGVQAVGNSGVRGRRGEMTVDVPQGPLALELLVGRIDARVAAPINGPMEVRSEVGDAVVTLDGRRLVTPREPGPGHRVSLQGDGPAPLRVRVKVGQAALRVGGSDRD